MFTRFCVWRFCSLGERNCQGCNLPTHSGNNMAQAPLKQCCAPGCKRLIRGKPRCDECEAKRPRRRTAKPTTKHDVFTSNRRWRALRLRVLAATPLCVRCQESGKVTAASEVHHIQPRRSHPELAYVVSNLEALCKPCHSRETMRERYHHPG